MQKLKNFPIHGNHDRSILTDLSLEKNSVKKPLIIFCHGYKGYKDWGVFGKMDALFVEQGFALLKFNFSHNGGTLEQPIDFPDLEAFGKNTYSKELDDLQSILHWITTQKEFEKEIDFENITLIGHSRGGGIAVLTAAKDSRIKKLITWAAVCTLDRSFFNEGEELEEWKKKGVIYIENGRTKQQMPHFIEFYEDFMANRDRFNIEEAAKLIDIPHLILHGDGDMAVPFSHAENLHQWNPKSHLVNISGANHVFGARQPWNEDQFPTDFQKVLEKTFKFLAE